jgi:Na+-driven multidrug efflux pump
MFAAIAGAFINVLLDYWLIPSFGLLGCAWATTVAFAGCTIVLVLLVDWRLLESHSWVLQTITPIVVGGIYASVYRAALTPFLLTLLLSVSFGLMHRRSIRIGFRTLANIAPSRAKP